MKIAYFFFWDVLIFVVIYKLFFGNFSRVRALSLISVFTRRQGKKIPSANATKQTKVQLKPHPLSLLRALIQVSKKKKKKKKKKEERLMLSHYTPPENATHAMLRDARRDGLSGLVSNGQAVNVTHYFYRWRRRRSKFHSLRWSLGLVGNCCIQPLPFANKK